MKNHQNTSTKNNFRSKCIATACLTLLFVYATPAQQRKYQLVANDSAFWQLVPHDAQLTTLGTGFGFTEGPVWDNSGYVWVSDESANTIFRLFPDGHRETMISLGDPDGNTYDRHHRLIDCASVLRAVIRLSKDGRSTRPWRPHIMAGASIARMISSWVPMVRSTSRTPRSICLKASLRKFPSKAYIVLTSTAMFDW